MGVAGHWIDYVILGIVGLSILTGVFRGFVKELIALCVWALGIWLAFSYSQQLVPKLQPYVQDKTASVVIAFIAILLGTLVVGGIVNALLSFILQRSGLSGTDRLLGLVFGFARGMFIVALVILVVKMTSIPDTEYRQHSYLYARFDPIVNWLYGFSPEFIKRMKKIDKSDSKDHAVEAVPEP